MTALSANEAAFLGVVLEGVFYGTYYFYHTWPNQQFSQSIYLRSVLRCLRSLPEYPEAFVSEAPPVSPLGALSVMHQFHMPWLHPAVHHLGESQTLLVSRAVDLKKNRSFALLPVPALVLWIMQQVWYIPLLILSRSVFWCVWYSVFIWFGSGVNRRITRFIAAG